jgi:formylglycine-generating enzyme required for sulfatase activity
MLLANDSASAVRNQRWQRRLVVAAAVALMILGIVAYFSIRVARNSSLQLLQKTRELEATAAERDSLAKDLEKLKQNDATLSDRIAGLNASAGTSEEERNRIARQKSDLEGQLKKALEDNQKLTAQAARATDLLASVESLQRQLDQARRERVDAVQGSAAEAKQRQEAEGRATQLETRLNSLTKEIESLRASVTRPVPSTNENPIIQPLQPKEPPPLENTNAAPVNTQRAGQTRVDSKDGLTYVWIPPGKFMMGCSPGDKECDKDEKPQHEVTITRGFWMGQTPVTQEAYQRVIGTNPSYFKGSRLPVERVNWNEALAYCTAVGMRLPTEAEWEYAARSDSTAARYANLDEIAWYAVNSGRRSHDVSQKKPNAFGLYDMLGNVYQWTADWSGEKYSEGNALDPWGPSSGQRRVLRGGPWGGTAKDIRASVRSKDEPAIRYSDLGFRCATESLYGFTFPSDRASGAR